MLYKSINQNDTTPIPMELDDHPSVNDKQKIVDIDKFEPSRVKKPEIIYHDGGDDDVLYDYGIHKSGKLINPAGHWVNDGFNETRRLPEDVFREQIGIEKIGNAENWRAKINA